VTAKASRIDLDERTEIPAHWRGAYISIGNFDGVHLGHADLARRLRLAASADPDGPRPTLAVTFDPHPVAVLRPDRAPSPLTTIDRRVELLLRAGVDGVVVFRTGPWLLGMTARDFFDRIVLDRFGARGMIEGPTFGFGRDRRGDVERLAAWCRESGLAFEVAPPCVSGGELVSSSRVREALAAGRLGEANELLGRPHRLGGTVVRGAARGAAIGFPTANLGGIAELVPADGVYATLATVEGLPGGPRPAATHIGPNSTFGERARSVEAHLLDFSGDLYGRKVELDLVAMLRGSRRFDGVEALLEQIRRDVEETRRRLGPGG
jgi:riboflavin kinase/FMN adenylyltransferase